MLVRQALAGSYFLQSRHHIENMIANLPDDCTSVLRLGAGVPAVGVLYDGILAVYD
jgi:hypothetical protein